MLTQFQYDQKSRSNALHVRALLKEAFDQQVPQGHLLSDDPTQMLGNALLRLRPHHPKEGEFSWHFFHALQHRLEPVDGEHHYVGKEESIRASAAVFRGQSWTALRDLSLQVRVVFEEHSAAVRELASKVLVQEPFLSLQWRVCPHDKLKFELFAGARKLQAIWRGPTGTPSWGTYVGNCHRTKAAAEREAVDAARFMLSCEHQSRLAAL